jgi:hypothetical protein
LKVNSRFGEKYSFNRNDDRVSELEMPAGGSAWYLQAVRLAATQFWNWRCQQVAVLGIFKL